MGYVFVNRFITHLHIVTANNYNTATDFHTLQIAKSSPVCSVFTSRCLVTALNSGGSSASVVMSLPAG
jgi:hypothetical protein